MSLSYFKISSPLQKSVFTYIDVGSTMYESIGRAVDDCWRFPENKYELNNFLVLIEGLSIRMEVKITSPALAFKKYVEFRDRGIIDEVKSVLSEEELEVVMEIIEDIERLLK